MFDKWKRADKTAYAIYSDSLKETEGDILCSGASSYLPSVWGHAALFDLDFFFINKSIDSRNIIYQGYNPIQIGTEDCESKTEYTHTEQFLRLMLLVMLTEIKNVDIEVLKFKKEEIGDNEFLKILTDYPPALRNSLYNAKWDKVYVILLNKKGTDGTYETVPIGITSPNTLFVPAKDFNEYVTDLEFEWLDRFLYKRKKTEYSNNPVELEYIKKYISVIYGFNTQEHEMSEIIEGFNILKNYIELFEKDMRNKYGQNPIPTFERQEINKLKSNKYRRFKNNEIVEVAALDRGYCGNSATDISLYYPNYTFKDSVDSVLLDNKLSILGKWFKDKDVFSDDIIICNQGNLKKNFLLRETDKEVDEEYTVHSIKNKNTRQMEDNKTALIPFTTDFVNHLKKLTPDLKKRVTSKITVLVENRRDVSNYIVTFDISGNDIKFEFHFERCYEEGHIFYVDSLPDIYSFPEAHVVHEDFHLNYTQFLVPDDSKVLPKKIDKMFIETDVYDPVQGKVDMKAVRIKDDYLIPMVYMKEEKEIVNYLLMPTIVDFNNDKLSIGIDFGTSGSVVYMTDSNGFELEYIQSKELYRSRQTDILGKALQENFPIDEAQTIIPTYLIDHTDYCVGNQGYSIDMSPINIYYIDKKGKLSLGNTAKGHSNIKWNKKHQPGQDIALHTMNFFCDLTHKAMVAAWGKGYNYLDVYASFPLSMDNCVGYQNSLNNCFKEVNQLFPDGANHTFNIDSSESISSAKYFIYKDERYKDVTNGDIVVIADIGGGSTDISFYEQKDQNEDVFLYTTSFKFAGQDIFFEGYSFLDTIKVIKEEYNKIPGKVNSPKTEAHPYLNELIYEAGEDQINQILFQERIVNYLTKETQEENGKPGTDIFDTINSNPAAFPNHIQNKLNFITCKLQILLNIIGFTVRQALEGLNENPYTDLSNKKFHLFIGGNGSKIFRLRKNKYAIEDDLLRNREDLLYYIGPFLKGLGIQDIGGVILDKLDMFGNLDFGENTNQNLKEYFRDNISTNMFLSTKPKREVSIGLTISANQTLKPKNWYNEEDVGVPEMRKLETIIVPQESIELIEKYFGENTSIKSGMNLKDYLEALCKLRFEEVN